MELKIIAFIPNVLIILIIHLEFVCIIVFLRFLPSSNPSELNDDDVAIPIVCPAFAFDIEPLIRYR